MRLGICSIGTEVVVGDQIDTNAAWLSAAAREVGAEPLVHVAARDRMDEMVAALRWMLERCDAVVVGGGLGPTPDDLTREAIAEVAGVALEHRDDLEDAIRERFLQFGARMGASNLRQARVPAGAQAWPPVGTAPAFRVDVAGVPVFALPGVPWEAQALFTEHVAPALLALGGGQAQVTRVVHVAGRGESHVAEDLAEVERDAVAAGIEVAYLATRHEVQVKLIVSGATPEAARAASEPWVARIRARLGPLVAGLDDETVQHAIVALAREAGVTVAVAESATAGLVCARMAEVPGASAVLRGGMVVYATASKTEVLGIDAALLQEHAPVSAPVTRALAEQVRARFGATYGVATTGVAGPDPQDGVAVGTVCWAVCGPDGTVDATREFVGDRETIRGRLATAALELLRRELLASE